MFDSKGNPTLIRSGSRLIHYITDKCLGVVDESGNKMRWPTGDDSIDDDKKIAYFIRDENDFREFAMILADTHGLSFEVGPPCPAGPTIIFVEENGPMRLQRQGEIALEVVKYLMRQRGITLSQNNMREFGNVAKAIGVSVEELKQFAKPLLQEMLDEYLPQTNR